MRTGAFLRIAVLFIAFALVASLAGAGNPAPRKAGPKDKCPVCGMFVGKYPDCAAQIHFKNGQVIHFDGAKDMFRYYRDLKRYAPGKSTGDIAALFVTDYYDLTLVDGMTACYVTGSNVLGPMGRELVPFADPGKAAGFLKDHQGELVVRFKDVTQALLKRLD